MRGRSILLALLTAAALLPTGAAAAAASTVEPAVGSASVSVTSTTSAHQRRLQAARAGTLAGRLAAPVRTGPVPLAVVSHSDRVLALTNRERTSRGLRALVFSSCADGYADSWALALSRAGALSHQPLRPVLTACRARGVGENVAHGTVTAEQLVAMWMASPGHRANLLNPAFTHLGVSAVTAAGGRVYGVQVFLTV